MRTRARNERVRNKANTHANTDETAKPNTIQCALYSPTDIPIVDSFHIYMINSNLSALSASASSAVGNVCGRYESGQNYAIFGIIIIHCSQTLDTKWPKLKCATPVPQRSRTRKTIDKSSTNARDARDS